MSAHQGICRPETEIRGSVILCTKAANYKSDRDTSTMKFLIVGDSHTRYFGISNQLRVLNDQLRGINCIPKVIHGATVTGVGKLTSTLNVGSDIPKWIDSAQPDFLVLNLGQVDVELGIPFRKYVQNVDEAMDARLDYFIESYLKYIDSLNIPASRIIVKGINLPVLCYDRSKAIKYITRIVTERFTDSAEDESRREETIKKLTQTYASDVVRSDLARRFNEQLQSACQEHGYGYFDINGELADQATGIINPRFIPAGFDHHIIDSLEVRTIHWNALLEVARKAYWV